MRRFAALLPLLCSATFLAACEREGAGAGDTLAADTGMATPPAAAPAPEGAMSLAALAGRWNFRSVPETGTDTAATTYVLTATSDTTGWTLAFPNRDPIPMRVMGVAGDSVMLAAGPFESARRAGVQVSTHTTLRMQGDRLVGTTVARYVTTGPDSVLRLRTEGTRAP